MAKRNSIKPVTIRAVREDDLAGYRRLRLEALCAHPEAFGADYDQQAALPDDHWLAMLRRGIGTPQRITYVADAGADLAGMLGIYRLDGPKMQHTAVIWGVYVRAAWRGAGVADALLTAAIDWAQAHQVRAVKLSVVTTNRAAIRCYMRHGFYVYGVEPEVIASGGAWHDELLMRRALAVP